MSSSLANLYLRPEDLSPLPTTMDAKKSPLALLAQTCSNIGADLLPQGKSMIPALDGRAGHAHSRHRSSGNSNHHSISHGHHGGSANSNPDSNPTRSDSANSDRTIERGSLTNSPANSDSNLIIRPSSVNQISNSNTTTLGNSNSAPKISFKPYETSPNNSNTISNNIASNHKTSSPKPVHEQSRERDNQSRKRSPSMSPKDIRHSDHKIRRTSSSSPQQLQANHLNHHNNQHNQHKSSSQHSGGDSRVSAGQGAGVSYTSTGLSELAKSHLTQMSKENGKPGSTAGSYARYHALAAAGHAASHADLLKLSHARASPYMQHHGMGMKAPGHQHGGVCRDPYCKGCGLSSPGHAHGVPSGLPCANGCASCVHPGHTPLYPPGLGLSGLGMPPSGAGGAYGLGGPGHWPFTCHWTAGGAYCGKSFGTCEELLQHLKTHTIGSAGGGAGGYPGLGGYYAPPPGLGGMGRSSAGLEALARYHPYKQMGHGGHGMGAPGMGGYTGHGSLLASPAMSVFNPTGHHPNLSSYYALLNGRLAGHSLP